jgi:hypothetical protein
MTSASALAEAVLAAEVVVPLGLAETVVPVSTVATQAAPPEALKVTVMLRALVLVVVVVAEVTARPAVTAVRAVMVAMGPSGSNTRSVEGVEVGYGSSSSLCGSGGCFFDDSRGERPR